MPPQSGSQLPSLMMLALVGLLQRAVLLELLSISGIQVVSQLSHTLLASDEEQGRQWR